MSRLMKRFQSIIAVVGMLCAMCVFVGCGNDDDDDSNDVDNNDTAILVENLPSPPTKIAFSSTRDGNAELSANDLYVPRDIFVMDSDGANVVNLTKTPDFDDRAPDWSPNGNRIVFESSPEGTDDIFAMNADGTNMVRLTTHADFDHSPAWSPNGNPIAFMSVRLIDARGFNQKIFLVDADGTNLVWLTKEGFNNTSPDWSPDGNRIVFSSIREKNDDGSLNIDNSDIYVMNADGTTVIQLTTDPAADRNPNWSPDGEQIVFEAHREPEPEIYVMNVDGTNQTNITKHPAADGDPVWSPDGTQIAFNSIRDGNWEIYVMNTDGTNQVNITNNPKVDVSPAWNR